MKYTLSNKKKFSDNMINTKCRILYLNIKIIFFTITTVIILTMAVSCKPQGAEFERIVIGSLIYEPGKEYIDKKETFFFSAVHDSTCITYLLKNENVIKSYSYYPLRNQIHKAYLKYDLVDSLFIDYNSKSYTILKFKESNNAIDGGSFIYFEKEHGILLYMSKNWINQEELLSSDSNSEIQVIIKIIKANLDFYSLRDSPFEYMPPPPLLEDILNE